ncbi:MAG: DUF86 domain-containing protein [Acidobacteriota bacterium]|jgi:uncharacterized protein YutE (UPF0331/DUF86 family)|nr:DUF86 domain-containing protein [Acidobacteriota bacterium]
MPIQPDDVCFNKGAIIERAVRRALEEFNADRDLKSFTHIDAMTLNLERACQAAIDWAMHLVAREHLGVPQSGADAFRLLSQAGLISETSRQAMSAMTGFRNIAVHEYQELDMGVLRKIVEGGWRTLVVYAQELGVNIRP